jgi:uncharacterized damage-inducible protein DinB
VSKEQREILALVLPDGIDPSVGLWLAKLQDTRRRLHERIEGLTNELIDAVPIDGSNTIGSLLYHIAAIEADWLYDDIKNLEEDDWPDAVTDLFPVDVREDGTTLSRFSGETLAQHVDRLDKVRTALLDTVSAMSPDDLYVLNQRASYDVSPAWALHHLMQHEAEHRSQIGRARELLGTGQDW